MKISERQKNFLTALHAAFGNEEVTTRAINIRISGLALKDPVNGALLQAIAGVVGRKIHSTKVGRLLEKIRGRRLGDLELMQDGEKRGGFWRYYIKDYAAPIIPCPDLEEMAQEARERNEARAEKLFALPPSKFHPAMQAELNRIDRAERKAEHEADLVKIKADPQTEAAYQQMLKDLNPAKPGPDSVPKLELPYPPPGHFGSGPAEAAPAEKPKPKWFPGCGRQPSRADLAARHVQFSGDGSTRAEQDAFALACAVRNQRYRS